MRAFTLIELLITIGIVAVLSVIGFINLTGYRERQSVELAGQGIAAVLRDAQNRSISQDSGARWGVHFENPSGLSGFYELFSGVSYSTGVVLQRANLPSNVIFNQPSSGASTTIIFSPVAGFPGSSTTVIISAIGNQSVSSTIIVNTNGEVQY